MITEEQITYIMQELGLDPQNAELRKVVERLAQSRPNVPIDDRFIALLREDIQNQANQFSQPKQANNLFSMFMNKLLASALIVMVALVAGGLWYIQQTDKPLFRAPGSGSGDQLLSGEYGVTSLDQESFGDLGTLAIVSNNARNQSGGGMGGTPTMAADNAAESEKIAAPGGNNPVSILPYPAPTNYTFDYQGEDITNLPATQDVLKRMKPDQPPGLVTRILNLLSFGLIDLSRFTDVKLQNFSFVEDREFGYGISVDLIQGMVNMYQNWEKWPQPNGDVACLGMEVCPSPQPRLKPEDLPSDEEAIVIADQFIAVYGISREAYGQPRVLDTWRAQYELAADRTSFWIPEQVQVIYPLVLEGKEVMDEGGYPNGLNIMVDARTRRVASVYELSTKQFEKSQYQGETDAKRIVEIAERGGFRNYPYKDPNAKNVELQLDTPSLEMVKIWYSTDNYRTNSELYVPAYVFPIKNWEKTGYWRQNVIVPLVRDILNTDRDPGQPIPLDTPMPVEPDGGNGSSSSSPGSAGVAEPAILRAQ